MSEVEKKVLDLLLAAVELLQSGSPVTDCAQQVREYVVSEKSYLQLLQRVDDIRGPSGVDSELVHGSCSGVVDDEFSC